MLEPHLASTTKIIEIGAGSGATSLKFAEYNVSVTSFDYSQSAISLIAKNAKEQNANMNIVQGDAFNLPFENESFDICFHQGLIEHFTNPLPMLVEQSRILKKDGLLLIQVPQRFSLMTIQKHILINLKKWFAGWETEYSVLELKKLLVKAGFSPLKSAGMFRIRNLDRIQMIFLKRRFVPAFVENAYHKAMICMEDSFIGPWIANGLIVLARKL
jgi:ubiquinone/menaquinone biosynthesis C-methylase UbiE